MQNNEISNSREGIGSINNGISSSTENNDESAHIAQGKKLMCLLFEIIGYDNPDELHYHFNKYNDGYFATSDFRFGQTFCDVDPTGKALVLSYLVMFVKILGFKGIFDISKILIDKEGLVRYLTLTESR